MKNGPYSSEIYTTERLRRECAFRDYSKEVRPLMALCCEWSSYWRRIEERIETLIGGSDGDVRELQRQAGIAAAHAEAAAPWILFDSDIPKDPELEKWLRRNKHRMPESCHFAEERGII